MKKHQVTISGGDNFGVRSKSEWRRLGKRRVTIDVHCSPPGIRPLYKLKPIDRSRVFYKYYREALKAFVRSIPILDGGLKGRRVTHLRLVVPASALSALPALPYRLSVHVQSLSGRRPRKQTMPSFRWYAVQARFAVQHYGQKKGMQMYEDRMLLSYARNMDDAVKRLNREFSNYKQPYLGGKGDIVRWKFEKVIGVGESDPVLETGSEVFFVFGWRRLRPEHRWLR